MQISTATAMPVPADPTPISTIAHPMRRIPALDVALGTQVHPTGSGWVSLDDAVAGARELTHASNVPMVALLRDAATGRVHAWNVHVDITPAPERANWRAWYLENVVTQAGPAVIDWSRTRADLLAFVDGRAALVRPGVPSADR
jgi:hypothetical protein